MDETTRNSFQREAIIKIDFHEYSVEIGEQ
jgi:hypothetical protein